uniref:S-formylglutathione hydrolase n=1 Tax=Aceria tosichella TaxID=561515 RepID=A0A6G1SJ45_9ACAR
MINLKQVSCSKCFEGHQYVYEHESKELGCQMKFAIYLPSASQQPNAKLPVVYYLSGLTCTEQNMITKSGFQRYAEKYKLVVVGPDTSPRNCNVPGEEDVWDLGTGAGFYVDATQEPWSKHYRMYSYVTKELRSVVDANFPCVDSTRVGITGHSMGGHGALVCFLRNPDIYKAVTAFAPISNPLESSWGVKCLTTYLGSDKTTWTDYDATELVKRQPRKDVKIVVEQGSKDEWMSYLAPENFKKACETVGQALEFNLRDGYDHGYYFVSTFIENHLKHFSEVL